jgi:hypothetical protein
MSGQLPRLEFRRARQLQRLECRSAAAFTDGSGIHRKKWWRKAPTVRGGRRRRKGQKASPKMALPQDRIAPQAPQTRRVQDPAKSGQQQPPCARQHTAHCNGSSRGSNPGLLSARHHASTKDSQKQNAKGEQRLRRGAEAREIRRRAGGQNKSQQNTPHRELNQGHHSAVRKGRHAANLRRPKTTPQAVKHRQRHSHHTLPSAHFGGSSKYSYETYEDISESGKRFHVNSLF